MDSSRNNHIEDAIIPEANRQYLDSSFWEQRYSQHVQQRGKENDNGTVVTREWLGNYSMFADIFRQAVDKSASILILGLH